MSTSLEESARLAGAHQWAEIRLFEILGRWVPGTTDAGTRLMFDRHSGHSAWRAAQWWDRLPVLADVDRPSLCVPPSPTLAEAMDQLEALDGTVARLAGMYRVAMPRRWAAYERHRSEVDGVADSASERTLRIVGVDLAGDWHEGEAVLQGLLTGRALVQEAADALSTLEGLLTEEP